MKKRILLGLGVSLLLTTQIVEANGLLGYSTAPIRSNFSFNNGVKMYAGVSAGYAMQGNACNMPFFEGSCEDGSAAWKVFGGTRINPMLGAELAYTRLGSSEKNGVIGEQGVKITNQISGYQLTGVGYLPINNIPNLEMTGKAGAMFWERESSEALGLEPATHSTDDGISPMVGLGAQYQLDQNLHVRTEWEHVFNTGSGSDHETDADNYSVGLMYSTL